MSLRLAARRLAQQGAAGPSTPETFNKLIGPTVQRRNAGWKVFDLMRKKAPSARKGQIDTSSALDNLDDRKKRAEFTSSKSSDSSRGSLADSVFQDEIDEARKAAGESQSETPDPVRPAVRSEENTAFVLNPDPRGRLRWHRKKIIQMVRKNGELTKEERIKMTERQMLHKSEYIATSTKKLVMLARQIAGKPVDEAILQMQWSKKKMAAEIKYHLEEARDLAIAQRGMGLGKVNGETLSSPRKIKTREGKWTEIDDPTRMYVAQSWVGRGTPLQKEIDYKGRGRMGIITHPKTSITVLLKEEKTRIREYDERVAKQSKKGPWQHLPNRALYHQRPYYSW